MIAWILSRLFPPRLPGKVRDWPEPAPYRTLQEEQGWAGNVKRRFTGIERYQAEQRLEKHRLNSRQYLAQLRAAEEWMVTTSKELLAGGYVNMIHDCWEKVEPEPSLGELQKLALQGPPRK